MLTTPWRLLITCRTRYKVLTKADSKDMNLSKLREIVKDRETWRAAVHGVTKSWTRLSDWTTTTGLSALEDVLRSELHSHLLWESSLNLEGWTQVLLMLSPACAHAVSVSSLLHCVEMSNDLPSFVHSISPAQRRVSFVLLAWPYSWHRSGCSLNTYWTETVPRWIRHGLCHQVTHRLFDETGVWYSVIRVITVILKSAVGVLCPA